MICTSCKDVYEESSILILHIDSGYLSSLFVVINDDGDDCSRIFGIFTLMSNSDSNVAFDK